MIVPPLSTWFVELVCYALLIVAVRAVCGQWLGPVAKRLLWTLLILKALLPFAVPTAYHPLGIVGHVDYPGIALLDSSPALPDSSPGIALRFIPGSFLGGILVGVWFLGFASLLGIAVWRNRSVVFSATKKPVAVPDWVQTIFLDCRETLKLGTWPVLVVSAYVPSPCLVGAVRPRILIPESLIEQHCEEAEKRIRYLLLHELVHLKQGDIWLAWLWTVTFAVHWFNPLFWIFGRFLKFDCETACDDRVLTILGQKERQDYGDSLIQMMIEMNPNLGTNSSPGTALRSVPGSLSIVETRSNLERRLTMMKSHRTPSFVRKAATCGIFLILGLLCLTSYAQSKPPVSADKAMMMGYVEDFFMNNYRDITMRKSLEWGEVKTGDNGNRTIRYKYEALIWDKERLIICDDYTFDKDGNYVDAVRVEGFPQPMEKTSQATEEEIGIEALKQYLVNKKVSDFKELDFSSPEAAYASYNKISASRDKEVIANWEKYTAIPLKFEKRDFDFYLDRSDDWVEVLKTAEILKVCIYDNQLAIVIAKLGGENTQNPYDVRSLKKVGDQWLNGGNGRVNSEDEAIAKFASRKVVKEKAKEKPDTPEITAAEKFLAETAAGNYEKAVALCNETMKKAMPADQLKKIWADLTTQLGKSTGIQVIKTEKLQEYVRVHAECRFQKGQAVLMVVVDKDMKITGLFLLSIEQEKNLLEKPADANPEQTSRKKAQEGWRNFMQGNFAESEQEFATAKELDPTNVNAYQGLGWAQLNQGKREAALETFSQCMKLDPKNTAALNGLGRIAQLNGDIEKAIEFWTLGANLDPKATGPMAGLAAIYDDRDDYENAAKYYGMWLRAEPNNEEAKAGLKKVKEKAAKE